MSQQMPNRKPVPLNQTDVMSTWMFAEPAVAGGKRPNLKFKVLGNVPRIVVKTQVDNDMNHGRIDFNTDLATFSTAMITLRDIAKGVAPLDAYQWEYVDFAFAGGQRSETPVVRSTLKIGKDRETGRIYIAVLANNRPRIQFFFGPSQYHTMKRGDGTEITPAEASAAYAVGFVDIAVPVITQLLNEQFDADAKNVAKPQFPQGGGQPQESSGGSNQGYKKSFASKPADGFDDVDSFDDF